jgi:hypothetical protein
VDVFVEIPAEALRGQKFVECPWVPEKKLFAEFPAVLRAQSLGRTSEVLRGLVDSR